MEHEITTPGSKENIDGVDDAVELGRPFLPDSEPYEEEVTKVEMDLKKPMLLLAHANAVRIRIMMVICIFSLITSGFLVYWQTAVMGGWRNTNRQLLLEIRDRVVSCVPKG